MAVKPSPNIFPHSIESTLGDRKLLHFSCTGNNKIRVVKAPNAQLARTLCMEKYGYDPEVIEQTYYTPPPFTAKPLIDNEALAELKKKLNDS